ncbi:hypothetical protein LZ30DRAFT_773968 [Colletotrichum cereale]|nr:hypothetical protein LZ30DRAFT_773968 [Colletotrichum cereale]
MAGRETGGSDECVVVRAPCVRKGTGTLTVLCKGKQVTRDRQGHKAISHTLPTLTGINTLEIPDPCFSDLDPSAVPGPEGDVSTHASVRSAKKKSRQAPRHEWKLLRQKLGRPLDGLEIVGSLEEGTTVGSSLFQYPIKIYRKGLATDYAHVNSSS